MARLLSIGFEIECLVPGVDSTSLKLVQDIINAGPSQRARFADEGPPDDTHWVLKTDDSIEPLRWQWPVEIMSPPFHDMPQQSSHSILPAERDWKNALHEVLAPFNEHELLSTNFTTGLHVHIGMGIGMRWSITELRKIALLFVLFEKQFDMYHAPHRWKTNHDHNERYIKSMRNSPTCRPLSDHQLGISILGATSWEELAGLINPDPTGYSRNYKVNFSAVAQHGTVEFRQHEGTVDPDHILYWGTTLLALVRLAVRADDQALLELCLSPIKVIDLIALAKTTESQADMF
ncbi:hypothetical protein CALVIDRAFT_601784 [Calocera viscosa TUFC12733]|uniref:Amidoligase enzyme n=1 Tax=Calocera viscosa (strain TUFC12733) TaxID=1330018 RepID=A0A167HYH5_CALVF|nr:hypothetical protein CALVIDRAFT_601784 [Calocera viscosa TUFC12733]